MIFAVKKIAISNKVVECGTNIKSLYTLGNNLTGVKKQNPMPENIKDEELSENFADFFLGKIDKIRSALADNPKFVPTGHMDSSLEHIDELSEEHVSIIIASLQTKSCELDPLPTKFLKGCVQPCLPLITKIVNTSLSSGTFVDNWKSAIVRPLIKKQGLDQINANYRPLSNLCFLSKVLEKAALEQFNKFCTENDLFPEYQSAYRANHSCETALISVCDDILWAMEHQKVTALAAIDLSAAFDTVDHGILLNVLDVNFGIRGVALEWIRTYLLNRSFRVNVNESYSTTRDLSFSVPQGSCLGPNLYSVYASTMQKVVPNSVDIHGYADDHAVKRSFIADTEEKKQTRSESWKVVYLT